jgi:TP901 family phage tail tape measure protein
MARTVTIEILGDSRGLEASLERAGLVAKGSGDAISDAFNSGSTKAGNALEKLGKKAEGLGIPFAAGLTTAGKHLDEATTKTGKLTTVMGELGKATLIAGGAGLAAVGVEAVKMGIQYESAQAKIKGATGISTKAAKEMTSAFGEVGKFGESSGEQAESAYAQVAGQLQATEGHALGTAEAMKVMSSATTLNTAVQGELASTTASLSAVMQAFHLNASQASGATDVLYNVSTRAEVPISSLTTAMDKLHARLGTLSPSLSDMGSLMVSLAEHGITGSRGIQVVSSAMSTLVGGSEKTTETLKALGVNIFNSQGKFIGMQGVIAQLGPKLAGLSQQQQIFAEKTLFGAGAYQVMGSVLQSGTGAYQKATDAATKSGTAQNAAAQQAKTLHGEFESAKASVETLGGDLGLILIPKLKAAAQTLAEGIQWLTKHKEAAIALGVVIGGPLAAAVTVYATTKAASFVRSTGEMAMGMYKLGAKVVEVVPTILTKMGLIGSTAQTTEAAQAAANEEMAANNVALAESYGMTEGEIKAAGVGIVESADTTAAGVDTAMGATGVGLVLVGLGLAATELATHWKTVMKGLEIMAQESANGIIAALNKTISVVEHLTLGLVHLGKIKELSGAGESALKESPVEKQGRNLIEGKHPGVSIPESATKGFSSDVSRWAPYAEEAAKKSGIPVRVLLADIEQETGGTPVASTGSSPGVGNLTQFLPSTAKEYGVKLGSSAEDLRSQIMGQAEYLKALGGQTNLKAALEGYNSGTPGDPVSEGYANSVLAKAGISGAAGGSSNSALAGLMNETSNAKGTKEAESEAKRAKEKSESKAESEQKKAEDEAKRNLETITKGGEALLKKYEAEIQTSTAPALEKALGVSTGTGFGSHLNRAGNEVVEPGGQILSRAAATGKLGGLEAAVGKSARGSEAGKQFQTEVDALNATHKKGLEELASKLVAAHKQALSTLAHEMVTTEETKQAEGLKLQATQEKDRTALAEHLATNQLNVVKAEEAQQTDALKAATGVMADETSKMADSFSALAQSIEAATQLMADATTSAVAEVKDQTTVEVGVLGERGLYGLNLIAQKEEVQLDQMRATYDQQINAAKTAEDQLKAQEQGVVAAKQQIADETKITAALEDAKAQQHLDAVAVTQAQNVTAAQQALDTITAKGDTEVQTRQLIVTMDSIAKKSTTAEAEAQLKRTESATAFADAQAEGRLGTAKAVAAREENAAQNALSKTEEYWAAQEAGAQRAITLAEGESRVALANAAQNLQAIEGVAAKEEARLEKGVAVEKERSQVQYAGSGLTLIQYGMEYDNADANASAITFALNHEIPA